MELNHIKSLDPNGCYHVVVGSKDSPGTQEQVNKVQERLKEVFPDMKIVVTGHGIRFRGEYNGTKGNSEGIGSVPSNDE